MRAEVDRILSARSQRTGRGPEAASVAAAAGLHLLIVAVAFLLPRLQPPPKPLEFVPVTVIPAQALGVRRPAPPRQSAPKPAEEPAAEEAATPAPKAPDKTAEPEPPKPKADEAPVLPEKTDKKKLPEPPKPEPKKPADTGKPAPDAGKAAAGKTAGPESAGRGQGNPNSPPNATAVGETGDQAGRRGAATGSPLGTTAFGSKIAGLDNPDFTYGYYLDRLLSLIDANWVRPSMGSGVRAIVSFRIQRDGTLGELKITESSGYNSFDLAALRAVQNASPFPPLPRPYRGDDLGVNLIVY
jgi:TonB family protein